MLRKLISAALLGALVGSAVAQTTTIQPFKRMTVPITDVWSTYSVQPQIQVPIEVLTREEAAENDSTPWLPRERTNTLRAGALGNYTRGTVRRFFPGPTDLRLTPPDNNMAVGPNHIVTVINSTIAFYTKTGTQLFRQQMDGNNGFFAGTAQTGFVFDPKAFYDPISNRYFVVALDLDTGSQISNALVAVSDDNNPNGTWFKYRVDTKLTEGGNSFWLDYPGFGFNKDAIIITGNMFGFANGYFGTQALVIRKADLLTGGTAQISVIKEPGTGTVQVARTTDRNTDKVWAVARGGGNALRVYAFSNVASANPTMQVTSLSVPAYSSPPGPAPSVNGSELDSLDGRIYNASFRNGRLVAAHTIGSNGQIVARWYDIKVNGWPGSGTPTLNQSGNLTGAGGAATHMPAINMNSLEDISVFYTRSSSSIAADLVYSARTKNDPLGTMGQPVLLSSSNGTYRSFRWGDYFSCEVDPADDSTFWGFGMGIDSSGNYRTEVRSWTVSLGGGAGTANNATSVSTIVGTYLVGDEASVAASDDLFYQVGSVSDPQLGQAAGVQADFAIPTDTEAIQVKLELISGASGATTMVYGWNWSTSQWGLIGSTPTLVSGNTAKFVTVKAADVSKFKDASGNVRIMLRAHIPRRPFGNVQPSPFTFRLDQLQLLTR